MKIMLFLLSLCVFLNAKMPSSWDERELGLKGLLSISSKNTRTLILKSVKKLEEKKYYENNLILKNLWLNFILVQSSKLVFLNNLERNISHINYTFKSLDKQALAVMKCEELNKFVSFKNKKFIFKENILAKISRPFLPLKKMALVCKKLDKKRFLGDLRYKKARKDLASKVRIYHERLKDFARKEVSFPYNPSYEEYFKDELGWRFEL